MSTLFIGLVVFLVFAAGAIFMFIDRIAATLARLTSNTWLMSWHKRLGSYASAILVGLYMAISGLLIVFSFVLIIRGLVELFKPLNLPPWIKTLCLFAVFVGMFSGALLRRRIPSP